jgi:hypothetical protein
MGYATILDIIGSIIAGGFLLLILARTNASAIQNTYNNNSDLITQQNLSTVVLLLENDFRKIGYMGDWSKAGQIDPTKAILYADSTSIKFIGDIDNDGVMDTVYYYVGPTSELSGTPNPNDRILYRSVSGTLTKSGSMGITQFSLAYFDDFGNQLSFPISAPGAIEEIQITLQVQNTEAYNGQYVTSYWRQIRLAARNLKNR